MNEWVNPSDAWLRSQGAILSIVAPHLAPRRVYLDKDCEVFCLVSCDDYAWATQWRWSWRWDRTKQKRYATRTGWRDGRRYTIYMHKAILDRFKIQRSEAHTVGDHLNGESLDNQRRNLDWQTVSGNRKNRKR